MYHCSFDGIKLTPDWRSQHLPQVIRAFMEKWQGVADEEMKTYKFGWPAKLVHTDFTYRGTCYRICPETFGIPYDLCECLQCGTQIEEKYGSRMDEDLLAIDGVTYVFSNGFLD